ncbi:DUF6890 family protein [Sodalis sp. RH18]
MREHYFPQADNSAEWLARTLWIDNRHWEYMAIAVNNGIATSFKGD